jgi:hypothetical protein
LNHVVDYHDDEVMPFKGHNAILLNPKASTILKWLRFKFQIFSLAQQWLGIGNQGMYFTKDSEIILNCVK